MKRDYTALLEAGNAAQIEKLEMNGHKKGFDEGIYELFTDLMNETYELELELYADYPESFKVESVDYAKARHEAADIANFAHMIILACDKELKPS